MISEPLGPSLEALFKFCGQKFSLKTVLQLADQLIPLVEYIHEKSFVHRNIRAENLLMGGTGKLKNVVHLIEFGLAENIRVQKHGHVQYVITSRASPLLRVLITVWGLVCVKAVYKNT